MLCEIVWQPGVIAIQKCKQCAASAPNAEIAGRARSAIFLLQVSDAGEIGRNLRLHLCAVGRTVVDDNDFKIVAGLREYRVQRGDGVTGSVEGRNDHAHQRHWPRRLALVRLGR